MVTVTELLNAALDHEAAKRQLPFAMTVPQKRRCRRQIRQTERRYQRALHQAVRERIQLPSIGSLQKTLA
jgi:hypothetical protein